MRNLTVKREKSFVGCLAKTKIYIRDEANSQLVIDGVPCRLLGELKSGEEKTFSIGTEETVIYAIADAISKDYCNDSYAVPAGGEDLRISGKNRFSPGSNAFCFDGQDSPEKRRKQKKNNRKGLIILLVCGLLGLIVGGFMGNGIADLILGGQTKTYAVEDMRITLTDDFRVYNDERFTGCMVSSQVGIMVLKEDFSLLPGSSELALEEYGHMVISGNGITGAKLCTEDGLTFFEFSRENADNGITYSYFAVVYKSSDAFWLVQFSTPQEEYADWRGSFVDWAKTVTFQN